MSSSISKDTVSFSDCQKELVNISNGAISQENPFSFELFNSRLFVNQPTVVMSLANRVKVERELESRLFEWITRSKIEPSASIAAANAITLLNQAEVNLSHQDFQGIRIPGAYLVRAILTSTNLSYADLRNVKLNEAKLDYSKMAFSQCEGLDLSRNYSVNPRNVVLSSNGRWAFTTDGRGRLCLWDSLADSMRVISTKHFYNDSAVSLSPDGKRALSVGDNHTLKLWDIETGYECLSLCGHTSWIESLAFSPKGDFALSGGWDMSVRFWCCKTGKLLHCFKGHSNRVTCVELIGGKAISGSADGTVRVWDISQGKQKFCFRGHQSTVKCIASNNVDSRIVSGGQDGTIRIWSVNTGEQTRSLVGHEGAVNCVAFSHNSLYLLSGGEDKTIRLWDSISGEQLRYYSCLEQIVTSVAFSTDGQWFFSASADHIVRKWNANPKSHNWNAEAEISFEGSWEPWPLSAKRSQAVNDSIEIKSKLGTPGTVNEIAISADGKWALSIQSNHTIRLWNCFNGKDNRILRGHQKKVSCITFSPDGQKIISGSWDQTVRIWDRSTGQELRTFLGHNGPVTCVSISSDGNFIVSGGDDQSIRLWDIALRTQVGFIPGHRGPVSCVAFSPEGSQIISGGEDHTVRVSQRVSGMIIHRFKGHREYVSALALSADGRWALSGSLDKTVQLWDCSTGKRVFIWKNYRRRISQVAFSAQGRYAIFGSTDKSVHILDCQTGQEVDCFPRKGENLTARLLPGCSIQLATDQPSLQMWKLFDENERYSPSMLWSTNSATLSARQLHIEGVTGLNKSTKELLMRHGAIGGEMVLSSLAIPTIARSYLSEAIQVHQAHALIYLMSQMLNLRDLISFEQASRRHQSLTEHAWKNLRKIEGFNFIWKQCSQDVQNQKWNYCLTKVMVIYVNKVRFTSPVAIASWQAFYANYQGIIRKFPALTRLIVDGELNSRNPDEALQSSQKTEGGEALLEALSAGNNYKKNPCPENLERLVGSIKIAIQNGATLASLLLLDLVEDVAVPGSPHSLHQLLGLEAMAKGDWRALEKVKAKFNIEFMKKFEDADYPPFLLNLANYYLGQNSATQKPKVETLCSRAMQLYGTLAPRDVFELAGDVMTKLEKWEQADQHYTKVMHDHGDNIPPKILVKAANAKFQLKQKNEAFELATQAFEAYNGNPPPVHFSLIIKIKSFKENWASLEADVDRFLIVCTQVLPPSVLYLIGTVKYQRDKLKDALQYFNRGAALAPGMVPESVAKKIEITMKKIKELESKEEPPRKNSTSIVLTIHSDD